MTSPVRIPSTMCGIIIPETHQTLGVGWDLCEDCRAQIVDCPCQDIPLYCQHCKEGLEEQDYMGDYLLQGDATHSPGMFWVFKHSKCHCWSKCHESPDKPFMEVIKEVMEQRETITEKAEHEGD